MDDLIDRELRRALAVTPSPEFIARVRMKIEDAPRQGMSLAFLKYAAAMTCAAAIMVGVSVSRMPTVTSNAIFVLSSTAYRPLTAPPVQSPVPVVAPNVSEPQRSGEAGHAMAKLDTSAHTRAAVVEESSMPEVLIAPQDRAALEQVVRNAQEYVVTFHEAPMADTWVMNDLTISPITVEPLESVRTHNN